MILRLDNLGEDVTLELKKFILVKVAKVSCLTLILIERVEWKEHIGHVFAKRALEGVEVQAYDTFHFTLSCISFTCGQETRETFVVCIVRAFDQNTTCSLFYFQTIDLGQFILRIQWNWFSDFALFFLLFMRVVFFSVLTEIRIQCLPIRMIQQL